MLRPAAFALVVLLSLGSAAARAAVLIEMTVGERPLRVVIDRPQQRVLITDGERRTWFDLDAGLVYHGAGDGAVKRAHARYRPGHDRPPPYRIERFGPGPIVAGQASTYQVLFAGEQVCAEMMLAEWMRPFVDPAIRAMASIRPPRDGPEEDACAGVPLVTYAAAGWPLLAGKAEHPILATRTIAFDYVPSPEELTPPAAFVDVPIEALRSALASYAW